MAMCCCADPRDRAARTRSERVGIAIRSLEAVVTAGSRTTRPRAANSDGRCRPNLNWNGTNQTRAVLTISNLDTNNKIGYYTNIATDLIVDNAAYFTT